MRPAAAGAVERVGVAVIGAGVAGLATAHSLARAGLPVTVFERRLVAGGRFSTTEIEGVVLNRGALMYAPALYPNFHALVSPLGIDWEPIRMGDLLLRVGESETGMSTWALFRSGLFSLSEFRAWQRLKRLIRGMRFDPGEPDPRLEALHSLDFLTYLKERAGFTDRLVRFFGQPFCSWAYADPEDLAADYGLYFFAFPVFQGMRTPRKGMQEVTDRLAAGLPERPRVGWRLERAEVEDSGGARLLFVARRADGSGADEREVRAGAVVFANGRQDAVARWLPGLRLAVPATKTRGVVLELRSPGLRPYRLLLYGKHENRHGVHGGEVRHLRDGRTLGGIFLYRPDADLEAAFPGHRVIEKVGWSPAISISTPGCSFPGVATPYPSIFVAGDFHRYCTIESCAYTAGRAAALVVERERRGEIDLGLRRPRRGA